MSSTQLQLLGHATFRITTPEGRIILVDPWLTDNPFIPAEHRRQPRIDLLVVTHGHEDHCDPQLPALIAETGPVLVVNNMVRWFLLAQQVPEAAFEPLNLGGTIAVLDGTVSVTMVNAFHVAHVQWPDGRIDLPHQAVGFVLRFSDGACVYFAGDTSVFGDMQLIGQLYQPTLAVLPIGDRYTMGPLEAAHAIRLLNVRHVVPFHYGTYPSMTGTPAKLAELTQNIPGLQIHALQAGETLDLAGL
jgi:L-ascorbate metabolism protein UlaG (beta-lactamase superfamily)